MKLTLGRAALALTLACTLALSACTDAWLKIALQDLPVLVQMALNIAALTSALDGAPTNPSDIAAINAISAEAKTDLTLLDTLYGEYKTNPSTGLMAQIEKTITDIDTNLPALLSAAHIKDPVLETRVTAAVGLILTTVETFTALIPNPQTPQLKAIKRRTMSHATLPRPNDLKKSWNDKVYPQFKVSRGFWSELGTSIGEWKFGG